MSWLFASGGQRIGASASVLPMNIQDCSPLGGTGWISRWLDFTVNKWLHLSQANGKLYCSLLDLSCEVKNYTVKVMNGQPFSAWIQYPKQGEG